MKRLQFKNLVMAVAGIFAVGIGVAFNSGVGLGNDPIGILYDGIRSAGHLSYTQLGVASNLVNYALTLLLFFVGRRYVSIGTLIYILPYGTIVKLGTSLFNKLFPVLTWPRQLLGAGMGCLLVYLGVALYIAADIGMDPFNGLAMAIKDRLRTQYKAVKVPFDCLMIVLAFLLGGKAGLVTVFTGVTAGPCIQFFSSVITSALLPRQIPDEEDSHSQGQGAEGQLPPGWQARENLSQGRQDKAQNKEVGLL